MWAAPRPELERIVSLLVAQQRTLRFLGCHLGFGSCFCLLATLVDLEAWRRE